MARYIVERQCFGFKKRLWEKGQIVELDPASNPPRHFRLLDGPVTPVADKKKESAPVVPGGPDVSPEIEGVSAKSKDPTGLVVNNKQGKQAKAGVAKSK